MPDCLPFDRWALIITTLPKLGDAVRWAVGDALNYGEAKYGEKYAQAMNLLDMEYERLKQYCWVSRSVTMVLRNTNLSWSHHYEEEKNTDSAF